MFNVGIFH